ncbi:hypothetical protein ACVBEJ_10465 [Porticoccus sp. GXU_MW_L64]
MIQETVLVLSLVLMAVVLGGFVFVALNASKDGGDYQPIQKRAYGVRRKLFWLLLVAGIPITVATTVDLPFAATRGDVADADRQIEVVGYQWYWQLSGSSAEVGETVVFNVAAADVSHGLGVYDKHMRLIGQTQAMPGYTNSLKLTFEQPGTYKLMCLEYCGLAHHAMVSDFIVTEKQQ